MWYVFSYILHLNALYPSKGIPLSFFYFILGIVYRRKVKELGITMSTERM